MQASACWPGSWSHLLVNTKFGHKVAHKCTWYQTTSGQKSLINFVVASLNLWLYVRDTRVKSGAQLLTEHHLVVSWIRWWGRLPEKPGKPKQIVRVNWECLTEDPVWNTFNSPFGEAFPNSRHDHQMDPVQSLHCGSGCCEL